MTNKMKQYPTPKFHSLEEEEKYWQSHSPLMEGYKGTIQRTKQQRTSFLSVRLTGEELKRLREQAIFHHMTPSAYVREVILGAVDKEPQPGDLLRSTFLQECIRIASEQDSSLSNAAKEAIQAYSSYIQKEAEVFELIENFLRDRERFGNQPLKK
jgi:predicted DNA-binding protein